MHLSPEKRNSLIKLGAITLGVVLAWWLLVINPARARVDQNIKTQNELSQKIVGKNKTIETADQIATQFQESSAQLEAIEDKMVSGDPYLWIIKTLGDFEVPDKIDFSKYDPPKAVDPFLPKKVRYQSVSFTVTGTANYHDLGKFLAKLENAHPHINVHRLELEPLPGLDATEEKLSFLLELYVLVKPVKGAPGAAAPRS